jgi:uncharacterized protein YjbI with pentapeptide repeats
MAVLGDMSPPKTLTNPLYTYLREDQVAQFNRARAGMDAIDLSCANLRGSDLRGADLRGVDFEGAYLRYADLRGLDLSQTNLRGASIGDAEISGVLFPAELSSEEIRLSHTFGTRMRYR